MKQIYNPLAGYLLRNYNKRLYNSHKGFSTIGFTYFLRQLHQHKIYDEVILNWLICYNN